MISVNRFWRALETVPGPAAVLAEWRHLCGADFELIQPFLRTERGCVSTYPELDRYGLGYAYRVVPFSPDRSVGICDELGVETTFSTEELVPYGVAIDVLARALVSAFRITPSAPIRQASSVIPIGSLGRNNRTVPVYLTIRPSTEELLDIFASSGKENSSVLLLPDANSLSDEWRAALRQQGGHAISLCEGVVFRRPGVLEVTPATESVLRTALESSSARTPDQPNVFSKQGTAWKVAFGGQEVLLEDSRGLTYIAHLLANAGREIHVADLLTESQQLEKPCAVGSSEEVIDARAMREYKSRIEELREELEEASSFNDLARDAALRYELDALMDEVRSSTGLGGRRRKKGDGDRIRKAVSNAISRSVAKIESHHADLARHLDNSIRKGQFLSYLPDRPIDWKV